MSIVQERWEREQCRIEDGVFFPSDEYILLSGTPDTGYRPNTRTTLEILITQTPDSWTSLTEFCRYSKSGWTVIGGGGDWEGEGFVAFIEAESNRLRWLLSFRRYRDH
jgi:hypothetical protein